MNEKMNFAFVAGIGVLLMFANCALIPAQESLWEAHSVGSDWPAFLGPNQDGKSAETGILTDWSEGKLRVVWQTEVGEGYSIGAVSGGRYIHFDRARGQARIRCLNAESGQQIWVFNYESTYDDIYGYDSGPRTSPVIDGDRVYTLGVEGQLTCLNINNGQLVWSVDTAKKFGVIQNFFGVGSSPVVADNLLLVMVGGSPAESQDVAPGQLDQVKSNGSAVVAFNKESGEIVYQLGDDLASYSTIKITSELSQQKTGLAFCRGGLIGFDVGNGEQKFSYPWRARILESANACTPVVADGKILLTECYGPGSVLLEVSNNQPTQIWSDATRRDKALMAHWNTPVVIDGFAYASSGRDTGNAELRCLELATGKVRWKQPRLGRASLTYIDKHFVLLSENGTLALIRVNPEKFDLVTGMDRLNNPESPKLGYPCWSAPIISHGLMFVKGDNRLVCFELIPPKS